MSVEKHPTKSGYYYVKSYPSGRKGKAHRDLVEGYDAAVALDNAIKEHKVVTPSVLHPRLSDVIDEYLLWAKRNLAPITYKTRERRLTYYVMPAIGQYRVKELKPTHIDSYALTVGKWTLHTDMTGLKSFISWMIKRKYAVPLDWKIEMPKGTHNIKPVPHPADLIAAINKLPMEIHRILMLTMLFTGMRWNECVSIRWENVDITAQTITMKETDFDQDYVMIPNPLLEWYQTHKKASGWVFKGRGDKHYSRLKDPFQTVSKILGRRFSSHTLRHCSGTYLYEQTDDLYKVQAHLRHKKISTTQIYARMSVSRRKSAIADIVDYVSNTTT